MASAFLQLFDKNAVKKHVNYQGHFIVIDNGYIEMDGNVLLRDGIYYYFSWATRILVDLLHVVSVRDSVINAPSFSKVGEIRECKHE